jgi:hypothetical protein
MKFFIADFFPGFYSETDEIRALSLAILGTVLKVLDFENSHFKG